MDEEQIRREVLEYLDYLYLASEHIDPRFSREYIEVINMEVNEYEKKLREEYQVLKRKNEKG